MKAYFGKQGKKGFTLLEVMLVVAILSIVMAITVPGLVRTSRTLKIEKLDDIAREIYTAAQSRSISLSVSGQLSQVGGVERAIPLADGGSGGTTTVTTISNVSGGGAIDMLLPLGSVEEVVRQNYYLIEYDPVTGMVRGVYYWENKDNDFLTGGYGTVRDKEDRMNYHGGMVGYYGGENVDRLSPPTPGVSSVTAELVNDEELYLKITPGKDSYGALLEGTITITLTDRDKNVSKQIASFDNKKNSDVNSRLTYEGGFFKLTLDSLKEELRFSKLDDIFTVIREENNYTTFYPGCELKVTVTFQENGKQARSKDFRTNSLYASVQEVSGKRTARIACGRHLENLGVRFVYPDGTYLDGTMPVGTSDPGNVVKKAVQIDKIDWHASLGVIGADPALVPFRPIVNDELEGFDGQGNTISHMDIFDIPSASSPKDVLDGLEKDQFGIGLFSRFQGNSLKNINLVDCTVKDLSVTAPKHVGLLAGKLESSGTCDVSDCHAYAAGTGSTFNCSIDVSGAANAGGLFGSAQNAIAAKCSASLTAITGGAYVGGLAGDIGSGVSISSCYADTGVRFPTPTEDKWNSGMSGTTVGGLLGRADSSLTLNNCYAVGWISSSTGANGLIGSGSVNNVANCYAAVMDENGIVKTENTPTGCVNYNGDYHIFGVPLPSSYTGYTDQNAGATHAYSMPSTTVGGATTPPVYPFPRLSGMAHYGDWPQEGKPVPAMAYYEVYEESGTYSIGFYNEAYDTLDDDKTLVMDGYAVMLSSDAVVSEVLYNGSVVGTDQLMKASAKFGSMDIKEISENKAEFKTIEGTTEETTYSYYPLFLSSDMMTESGTYGKPDSYYQKLKVTVGTETLVDVYFNPYVAKSDFIEVNETGTDTAPPTRGFSILRSSRQVTAYSYDAMQKTAIGSGETTHTLRLERNIDCTDKYGTDFTVSTSGVDCKDLNIPNGTLNSEGKGSAHVILELYGKTLIGTGRDSVVTSGKGELEVYGYT